MTTSRSASADGRRLASDVRRRTTVRGRGERGSSVHLQRRAHQLLQYRDAHGLRPVRRRPQRARPRRVRVGRRSRCSVDADRHARAARRGRRRRGNTGRVRSGGGDADDGDERTDGSCRGGRSRPPADRAAGGPRLRGASRRQRTRLRNGHGSRQGGDWFARVLEGSLPGPGPVWRQAGQQRRGADGGRPPICRPRRH